MKALRHLASFLLVFVIVGVLAGCSGGSGSSTPFFTVATVFNINGFTKPDPGVGAAGFANAPSLYCTANPSGTASFNGSTDSNGQLTISNAAVGGSSCSWTINRGASANCPSPNPAGVTVFNVLSGQTVNVPCDSTTIFNATPRLIDSNNPPASVTITGQGFATTYGMPQVTIYDSTQTAVLTLTASSASNGTSLTISGSQVSLLADATYGAVVYVKQADGTWDTVGGAGISIYTSQTINRCQPPMPCC